MKLTRELLREVRLADQSPATTATSLHSKQTSLELSKLHRRFFPTSVRRRRELSSSLAHRAALVESQELVL